MSKLKKLERKKKKLEKKLVGICEIHKRLAIIEKIRTVRDEIYKIKYPPVSRIEKILDDQLQDVYVSLGRAAGKRAATTAFFSAMNVGGIPKPIPGFRSGTWKPDFKPGGVWIKENANKSMFDAMIRLHIHNHIWNMFVNSCKARLNEFAYQY